MVIYNELDDQAAGVFLNVWAPAASHVLSELLGCTTDVCIVLSDTESHTRRFPPSEADLSSLFGSEDEATAEQWRVSGEASCYAHGVTKIVTAGDNPPVGLSAGDLAIFLDIPTIQRLAERHAVGHEAMLARVVTHELSHALRGHAHEASRATHGYLREGDAQRDAWQVLTDLLADPEWASIARWARAAQVRLATEQPPAYQRFGQGTADTDRWKTSDPAEPRTWIMRPARPILPLTRSDVTEVCASPFGRGETFAIGDSVFLTDRDLIVGPWTVIQRRHEPITAHDRDVSAHAEFVKKHREAQTWWLQLRRHATIGATTDPDARPAMDSELIVASRLNQEASAKLASSMTHPAGPLLETVARQREEDHATTVKEVVEELKRCGQVVPPGLTNPLDPWSD